MQISILSVGTRGDIQPFIALGGGLQAAGHRVRLATSGVFEQVVRDRGLDFAEFEDGPSSFVEGVIASGDNSLRRLLKTRRVVASMMEHLLDDAWRAVQGADLIVTSNLLIYPGYSMTDEMGVPSIGALLAPYLRTRTYPNPFLSSGRRRMGRRGNLLSYDVFNWATWRLYHSSIQDRRCRHSLPPLPGRGVARRMLQAHYPFLCAWSPVVVPRPPDWASNIHLTGYWFLDSPVTPPPSEALLAFLDAGPPPIAIGLGSMRTRDPAATTQIIRQALTQTSQRGILLTGHGGIDQAERSDEIFILTEAPHDWLFPRVAAVVHHGGAGTTAAGLRAGVPTITMPQYGDQFFWGQRVAALGAGPPPIPRKRLTAERLAADLRRATSDGAMQERAGMIGRMIRKEDGVAQAVRVVEAILAG